MIFPHVKNFDASVELNNFCVQESGSGRMVQVCLEPEGDISITTEQDQVRVSFDEFRAKFFPEPPSELTLSDLLREHTRNVLSFHEAGSRYEVRVRYQDGVVEMLGYVHPTTYLAFRSDLRACA